MEIKDKKWWQKEINPTISFFSLIIFLLIFFAVAVVFIKQYLDVWSEISQKQNQGFFIEDIQKMSKEKTEDMRFQDIVNP